MTTDDAADAADGAGSAGSADDPLEEDKDTQWVRAHYNDAELPILGRGSTAFGAWCPFSVFLRRFRCLLLFVDVVVTADSGAAAAAAAAAFTAVVIMRRTRSWEINFR